MIDIHRAQSIPGFMNDEELVWLGEQARSHHRIAEIGSWRGKSSVVLAENTPGTLHCVDTWDGRDNECLYDEVKRHHEGWLWKDFSFNTRELDYKIIPVKMESVAAAESYRRLGLSFDMIFIDASHGYEFVKKDIIAWGPLVEPGGLLCGHDFNMRCPGVMQAVVELVPSFQVMRPFDEARSIWWRV